MRGYIDSGWSAATQVKAVSPDIRIFAVGQGLVCPEASIAADVIRRVCSDLPGSQAAAGHPTGCIGTWENHTVPGRKLPIKPERQGGGMAVW